MGEEICNKLLGPPTQGDPSLCSESWSPSLRCREKLALANSLSIFSSWLLSSLDELPRDLLPSALLRCRPDLGDGSA